MTRAFPSTNVNNNNKVGQMVQNSKFEPRTFFRPPDGDGEGTERKDDSSSDEYESDDGEDVALRILNNIDRDDGFITDRVWSLHLI